MDASERRPYLRSLRSERRAQQDCAPTLKRGYFNDAMSITKRYFTSLFSIRSYASLI